VSALAHVLVVEDDADLRGVLRRGLERSGFEVRLTATAAEALEDVADAQPDVLVVDVGLPDADGRDLCQALRTRGLRAPVLFLTAMDAVTDRVLGLEAGGDDYMTKPFAFEELVARLRALLRRAGGARPAGREPLIAGDLRLDPVNHEVQCSTRILSLSPTEFRLLAALAASPGDTVRRGELVGVAWPEGAIVHDNTLDVYVARLRRKLRELEARSSIETMVGLGYRLR
jgi:two-component system response regulator MprA